MEAVYEGMQETDLLGMNFYGAHYLQNVDEGDVVCVRQGPCADVPHQFGIVTSVRVGGDGIGAINDLAGRPPPERRLRMRKGLEYHANLTWEVVGAPP